MKIALLGYGKMGKIIEKLAIEKGHTVVYTSTRNGSSGVLVDADTAIDFSSPDIAKENIMKCIDHAIPIVSGTTGWLKDYDEVAEFCEKQHGSFLYASNFSIGVNLFFKINEYTAKLMKDYKDYTVSVEEIHHTEKKDEPSGTAITITEDILRNSDKKEWILNNKKQDAVTITAMREHDVKGTHTVEYESKIDTISLKHEAHSREGFALGAILAAEWIVDKKGVFSMQDVLR